MLKTNSKQLTTMELATKLKCHPNTIYKYIDLGLPYTKIKNSYRFELNKVVRWFEKGESI